jgi:hypothetical protein
MKPFCYHGEEMGSGLRLFDPPKCCTFVAIAIGGAAVVGAGASIYSANQQSKAQKAAAQAQANSQNNANATNLQEFEESRGSTGSAVLPLYLTGAGGQQFEGQMGEGAVGAYNESGVPLSTFQTAVAPLAGAETKANQFTNDIFTGGVTNKLLDQARPVQQARLSSAKESAMTALNRTLDAIDAAQSGKGFSGDSFGNRNLRMNANLQAGDTISAANLANLAESQQIRNYGDVTLPSQNLSLPVTMAQQDETMTFLPQANFLNSQVSRQQPFNFFRIGPGTPPAVQPLPTAPPTLSLSGAIGQGVGALGSAALNYYLNRQLQQQQSAQNASTSAAATTSAYNANPFSSAPLVPYYGGPSGTPIDNGSGAMDLSGLTMNTA